MRTIKFRGKSCSNGDWFYGNLYDYDKDGRTHICDLERGCLNIDPNTVGQFTGLLDKNGKEIYEGDIVQSVRYKNFVYKVAYDQRFASFCLDRKQDMYKHYFGEAMEAENCEVIGNIHDNPELLNNND